MDWDFHGKNIYVIFPSKHNHREVSRDDDDDDDFLPLAITRSVLATPAHGGPRHTNALMYLSFQACGCWLRKYSVYMLPILWAMRTTGPPYFCAISSIISCKFRKYFLFSSVKNEELDLKKKQE